jgi:hypothetical protein
MPRSKAMRILLPGGKRIPLMVRPFWDTRLNVLDCLGCVSILLHVIANVLYNNADFIRPPPNVLYNSTDFVRPPDSDIKSSEDARALNFYLVVVNLLVIICIFALFVMMVAEKQFEGLMTSQLTKSLGDSAKDLHARLSNRSASFLRQLKHEATVYQQTAWTESMHQGRQIVHSTYGEGIIVALSEEPDEAVLALFPHLPSTESRQYFSIQAAHESLSIPGELPVGQHMDGRIRCDVFIRVAQELLRESVPPAPAVIPTEVPAEQLEALFWIIKRSVADASAFKPAGVAGRFFVSTQQVWYRSAAELHAPSIHPSAHPSANARVRRELFSGTVADRGFPRRGRTSAGSQGRSQAAHQQEGHP